MKNKALLFSTAVNLNETAKALESGEKHLSKTEYQKVRKAYKQLICHTLFWVLTAFLCAAGIVITGNKLSDIAEDELLKSYNATEYTSGVKAGPTTVLYTKGESYYFDTSVIGINLDSEYPNEISFILFLDDDNNLKGIESKDEFSNPTSIFAHSIGIAFIFLIVFSAGYVIYVRKFSPYGKIWYSFLERSNSEDDYHL